MSTNSLIAMTHADGTVSAIYCHSDGYPEHVGATLASHYATPCRVRALLELGSLSELYERTAPAPGEAHKFGAKAPGVCVAYHRDRGDVMDPPSRYACTAEFWGDACHPDSGYEWAYLFTPGTGWRVNGAALAVVLAERTQPAENFAAASMAMEIARINAEAVAKACGGVASPAMLESQAERIEHSAARMDVDGLLEIGEAYRLAAQSLRALASVRRLQTTPQRLPDGAADQQPARLRNIPEGLRRFWQHQQARGDRLTPVYALVAGPGSDQPSGYCMGWSVNKRAAQRQAAARTGVHVEKIAHRRE